ncbi:uncharacterized protein MELLADRAFT_111613 [Melampsora larici-populina 98AG31]|uniref:F-box domain-containing protein n=1 Tax=Melampsora larici-populina (strain 98AG31 / pathotype 3-4-7) TaxID=747676 RepID=F4S3S2_MELLP|nr:uncharacterized protein MELLADRAFT_111613 [Melampsora larici-populina 98AG31]EGG00723.1 hypothetical protein MELLADRAFT_111613 [Melampsora larici-populina 98AG31]
MNFGNFPVEIVYSILTEAVLEGDKLIVQADRLLQNGEARDNMSEPIPIDHFTTLSELYQSKKHHTKSINVALEFARYELDEPTPLEVLQIASGIFQASRLSPINEVVLWITIPDLAENTVEFWYHIHPILETTTEFGNLTKLEFSFSHTFWEQETTLAAVICLLKSLEVIKLCAHKKITEARRPESQAALGNSLSSLTRLESMSLEGLKSPNPKWTKLNWKSNIKKLSITNCKSFKDFSSLRSFFNLFHKSLIALRFNADENDCRALEDCGILKSFESLQQLTIYQNHHRNISILQQFSICPAIKFIHWIVSDPHPSKEQIRSLIFDLLILKNYQNRWRSLRSLVLPSNFANSLDSSTYAILDVLHILCDNYSVRLSYLDDNEYDVKKHLKFYI